MFARLLIVIAVVALPVFSQAAPTCQIRVTDAYAKPSIAKQKIGVAFVSLASDCAVDDALTAISSSQAGRVELHTTQTQDDIMRMRKVEKVVVPAHGQVVMQGGGLHVMLYELNAPLKSGDLLPMTLHFQHSEPQHIRLSVRK